MNKKYFENKMQKLRFVKDSISPSDEKLEQWCKLNSEEHGSFNNDKLNSSEIEADQALQEYPSKFSKIISMAAVLALVITVAIVTCYLNTHDRSTSNLQKDVSVASSNSSMETTITSASNADSESGEASDHLFGNSNNSTGSEESNENGHLNLEISDFSVENGKVIYSDALIGAIETYGDSMEYRVVVELFQDGVAVKNAGKEEAKRLSAAGYTITCESFSFENSVVTEYLVIQATMTQITEFNVSNMYGYVLFLYDEAVS